MLKVQEVPDLPKVTRTVDEGSRSYLQDLNRAIFNALRALGIRTNGAIVSDGSELMQAPLILASYTVLGIPTASIWQGALIYVSNEAGGATVAFSDGTNWRRVQDRAIVS